MSQNIYLEDGDYLYIPSRLSKSVNVLGAIRSPQAQGYTGNMTLVSAIAQAQGPTQDAYLKNVMVIRGSLTEPRVAVVDFSAILAGKARDIDIEPFDIIWVPDKPIKTLERYFWTVVDTVVSTLSVREGANAIKGDEVQSPQLVIPFGAE